MTDLGTLYQQLPDGREPLGWLARIVYADAIEDSAVDLCAYQEKKSTKELASEWPDAGVSVFRVDSADWEGPGETSDPGTFVVAIAHEESDS